MCYQDPTLCVGLLRSPGGGNNEERGGKADNNNLYIFVFVSLSEYILARLSSLRSGISLFQTKWNSGIRTRTARLRKNE